MRWRIPVITDLYKSSCCDFLFYVPRKYLQGNYWITHMASFQGTETAKFTVRFLLHASVLNSIHLQWLLSLTAAVASIWNGCWFHHCYPSILPVVGMDRQIETERWWVSGGGLQCPGKPFCYPWWWRLIKIWPPVFMLTVEGGGVFPTSALQTLHLYALQKCTL